MESIYAFTLSCSNGTPNSPVRVADSANNYNDIVKSLEGCDGVIRLGALPNLVNKDDWKVHGNNVNSAFNGLRAATEVSIKKFCYSSSVNAIGLAYTD